jgi:hypothetical protein
LLVVVGESFEEGVEVVAGVGPVEGFGVGVVPVLEGQDPVGEVVQVREVGRAETASRR